MDSNSPQVMGLQIWDHLGAGSWLGESHAEHLLDAEAEQFMQHRAPTSACGAAHDRLSVRGRSTHMVHANYLKILYFVWMMKNREQQPGSIPSEVTYGGLFKPVISTNALASVEICSVYNPKDGDQVCPNSVGRWIPAFAGRLVQDALPYVNPLMPFPCDSPWQSRGSKIPRASRRMRIQLRKFRLGAA